VRCHFQVELPEALLAEDVGHGLAGTTALQVVGKGQRVFTADDFFRPGVQVAAGLAQGGGQQQFHVQARSRRVRQVGGA
jgi:hypothetical protein